MVAARRPLARVALAAFLTLAPAALAAQAAVRGLLVDSLRAVGPAAGAEVVLMPSGRRSSTDERGRFEFVDVPAGRYTLLHAPMWLDSVGLPPLAVPVEVPDRGSVTAVMVLPSRGLLALDRCGGVMDPGRGLVVGELRAPDAQPLPDAIVAARWSELPVGAPDSAAMQYVAIDTTASDGRYALCGMPENAEVVVGARHPDGRRTGAIVLVVNPGVLARDLVLAPPARAARLTGRVVNAQGAPIPRADVLASASTSGLLRTDSTGRFDLQLTQGSRQVVIRAIGFRPRLLDVQVGDTDTALGDVTLEPASATLDTVVIRAAPLTAEELEFEYRRRTRSGSFLDERMLRGLPRATPNAVAALSAPWVRSESGDIIIRGLGSITGASFCKPRLFVDGADWGNATPASELQTLLQFARRIEVYRAAFAPPEFSDFDGCGALVLWIQ